MITYICYLFFITSLIFITCGIILLLRYFNDVGISLHAFNIINIYGINFFIFGVCFSNFSYQLLLETIVIVIINTLLSLTVIHIIFRKEDVGDLNKYSKYLELSVRSSKDRFKEFLKEVDNEENNRFIAKKEQEENINNLEESKFEQESEIYSESEQESERQASFQAFFSECMDRISSYDKIEEPNEEEVDEAIDETEKQIREQKMALKKKIEMARRNAYKTRNQEKIQETEKTIKEILDKYGLTEDMLDED